MLKSASIIGYNQRSDNPNYSKYLDEISIYCHEGGRETPGENPDVGPNQDAILAVQMGTGKKRRRLLVSADGSQVNGEKVSEKICAINEKAASGLAEENPKEWIQQTQHRVCRSLSQEGIKGRSTAAVLLETNEHWYGTRVGDSRWGVYALGQGWKTYSVDQNVGALGSLATYWTPEDIPDGIKRFTGMLSFMGRLGDKQNDAACIQEYLMELYEEGKLRPYHLAEIASLATNESRATVNNYSSEGFTMMRGMRSPLDGQLYSTAQLWLRSTQKRLAKNLSEPLDVESIEKGTNEVGFASCDGITGVMTMYEIGNGIEKASTRGNDFDAIFMNGMLQQGLKKRGEKFIKVTLGVSSKTGQPFTISIKGSRDHINVGFIGRE